MKKILYAFAVILSIAGFSGCEKYTDIQPKGKNLLNTANDLDQLLNYLYGGGAFQNYDKASVLVNDIYGQIVNVPNTISGPSSLRKVILTYDEASDRADLTETDPVYDGLYLIINRVANVTLENAETASGDQNLLKELKAEAYVIRAYLHYLLVNYYAKAYDPATAATDGGIPYVKKIELESSNPKNTVQEVYDNMLADIESALALNALSVQPQSSMRVGKAFAYAVKARILLSMRDYNGALTAADQALAINSTLEDHRPLLSLPMASRVPTRLGISAPDNLFYAYNGKVWPIYFHPSAEIINNVYEPGNIFKDSTNVYIPSPFTGLPGSLAWGTFAYEQNSGGLNTSHLYLAKAEALIRTNRITEGMDLINQIRIRRIAPYTALTAITEAQAMAHLQRTSRIEYLYTWYNFIDIKRWNKEGIYPIPIVRTINSVTYTLQPGSPLWIFPFPKSATQFNPTLTQNY
jgi:hypothetical protein